MPPTDAPDRTPRTLDGELLERLAYRCRAQCARRLGASGSHHSTYHPGSNSLAALGDDPGG